MKGPSSRKFSLRKLWLTRISFSFTGALILSSTGICTGGINGGVNSGAYSVDAYSFGQCGAAIAEDAKPQSCRVTCHEPHPSCSESARVIDTRGQLTQLINDGTFTAMGEYFDDGVTTFIEDTKKLIVGKDAVIADIKQRYERQNKGAGHMLSYTIEQPYAEVTGNRAEVTFVAKKVLAGVHPVDMESHSTEVFVKDGDRWKTLHYRGAWKKVSS